MTVSAKSIFERVSPAGLAEVVDELVSSEVAALDPLGPQVREAAVYLLSRMASEHRGDDLGEASKRIANLLQHDIPDSVVGQGKDALRVRAT